MFKNLSIFELLAKGGYTMIVLGFCSVLSVAVIIERLWYFYYSVKNSDSNNKKLVNSIKECLSGNQMPEAIVRCDEDNSSLAKVLKAGIIMHGKFSKGEIKEVIDRTLEAEIIDMEKYTGILATIGSVSPFIGLFGTVLGIMRAFHDLSTATSAGPSIVSAGIAEALITTAAGLFVAVPAVISYNYFSRRIRKTAKTINMLSSEFIEILSRQNAT